MSRPLSVLLAALIAASPLSLATSAAFAQSNRGGEHYGRGWDDNDGWRWGHHRRHRGHWGGPGISFSFGVPFPSYRYSYYRPYPRDCYRGWDGALYCRVY